MSFEKNEIIVDLSNKNLTIEDLEKIMRKLLDEAPSPYSILKIRLSRVDKSPSTAQKLEIDEILRFLLKNPKRFPAQSSKDGSFSSFEEEVQNLLNNDNLDDKKLYLTTLQETVQLITDRMEDKKNWSSGLVNLASKLGGKILIKELAKTHPFELQEIQRHVEALESKHSANNLNLILTEAINKLSKNNKKCLDHLAKIIIKEAVNLPNSGENYKENEARSVNVEKLVKDLVGAPWESADNTETTKNNPFKQPDYISSTSRKLKIAAKSYEAITKLNDILNRTSEPLEKLKDYQVQLTSGKIKDVLHLSPDSKVVSFIKKAISIIAKIVTLGMLEPPFMPQSQKLYKKSLETLRNTEKPDVLTEDKPKPL